MKDILKWLGVCSHQWKTIKEVKITSNGYYYGTEYHMRCEKCGKIKVELFRIS